MKYNTRRNSFDLLSFFVLFLTFAVIAVGAGFSFAQGVEKVVLNQDTFNPSRAEEFILRFTLPEPADVTVTMHDPDGRLVKTLLEKQSLRQGLNRVAWDGRDEAGVIVPDEAYYPVFELTTEKGKSSVVDPTTFSGGEVIEGLEGKWDEEQQAVRFVLPTAGRARVIAGIADGPMLASIADSEPYIAGLQIIPWDGMDSSGLIKVTDQTGWRIRIDAFTLPQWSIITQGNESTDFSSYVRNRLGEDGQDVPGYRFLEVKKTPRTATEAKLSPFAFQSRLLDQCPEFSISAASAASQEIPVITKDHAEILVELDELSRKLLNEVRFEIVYYLNFTRLGEEEQAYSPMKFLLPVEGMENGRYILTVNVASLTGQVGAESMEIEIQN
jgi:hypothetical protein